MQKKIYKAMNHRTLQSAMDKFCFLFKVCSRFFILKVCGGVYGYFF